MLFFKVIFQSRDFGSFGAFCRLVDKHQELFTFSIEGFGSGVRGATVAGERCVRQSIITRARVTRVAKERKKSS
jgi:hypothetical protein